MKHVLLVDDDNTAQFLSQNLLARVGIAKENVHTASNGQQAIDLFDNFYPGANMLPDIILLDLNMPIMNGFDFLEAFRRKSIPRKDAVKIVVLSSSLNPEDMKQAKQLGANCYLTKPLLEKSLKEIIETA
jgi:CheY-like chemotaxis protein